MRLIDADDAVARLENFEDQNDSLLSALTDEEQAIAFCVYCKVVGALEKMPTIDAVPVVRCSDCKHYKDGRCFYTMRRHGLHDDWFCADGTR